MRRVGPRDFARSAVSRRAVQRPQQRAGSTLGGSPSALYRHNSRLLPEANDRGSKAWLPLAAVWQPRDSVQRRHLAAIGQTLRSDSSPSTQDSSKDKEPSKATEAKEAPEQKEESPSGEGKPAGREPMETAELTWAHTIGGGDERRPSPVQPLLKGHIEIQAHLPSGQIRKERRPLERLALYRPHTPGPFKAWLYKNITASLLKHSVLEEPRIQDSSLLEADLVEGAAECLRHLSRCLDGSSGQPSLASDSLAGHGTEGGLANLLTDMVKTFCEAGVTWKWELQEVQEVRLDRIFLVCGACRKTLRERPVNIIGMLGQQLVLTEEQTQRFLKEGVWARVEVFQDLLRMRSVLVADVSLKVKQTAARQNPDGGSGSSADKPMRVSHLLRLEMPLIPDGNTDEGDFPIYRPTSWEIVDWNRVCMGNHPGLKLGTPAPW
mmetsp:Transcript_59849/g.142574  ORF Transcript_59849/g.142574 Transcript_59849/m.142574 type:complete len:436 (-) Transcript_59849:83-1390(-)